MWFAAFVSFFGSQLQVLAERQYVWQLTHSETLLANVGAIAMLPGTVLFPFVGMIVDLYDRRVVMTICMVLLGLGAAVLGLSVQFHFASYSLFFSVALLSGVFSTLEMPTRQSIIRDVVPVEDISKAVPLQAMTFNLARVVGPAAAVLLVSGFGYVACFYCNALSFAALIYSPWVMKADFKPQAKANEPLKDLIFEGMLYTMRHRELRHHFFLECATSLFSIFYINQLPAYVDDVMHLPAAYLGYAMTSVGVGAICGLILLGAVSERPIKPLMIRFAMTAIVSSLLLLALVHNLWVMYIALAVAGLGTITQFNTTNSLFQTTAPQRLKGRVLTMHFWALSGLAPIGLFVFGHVAQAIGLSSALAWGAGLLGLVTIWAWTLGFTRNDPPIEKELGAT